MAAAFLEKPRNIDRASKTLNPGAGRQGERPTVEHLAGESPVRGYSGLVRVLIFSIFGRIPYLVLLKLWAPTESWQKFCDSLEVHSCSLRGLILSERRYSVPLNGLTCACEGSGIGNDGPKC
jgi:hypothetical protein